MPIATHIFAADGLDDIIRWCSQQLRDNGELIDVVLAGEEWLALEHLCKDAASAPDIDLDIVLLPGEHDLRGSVVSRRDISRHLRVLYPGQAKVTDL